MRFCEIQNFIIGGLMPNALSNARHAGESFADYKARLALTGREIATRLRGRMIHEATRIVQLPEAGEDLATDEAVLRGEFRDLVPVTLAGKTFRIGRTKGVSFVKPKAA